MLVSFEAAKEEFERLPEALQSPMLHPVYVVADSTRLPDLEPVFFVHREGSQVYYHAFHISQVPGSERTDIQSPYGYGGPISSTDSHEFLTQAWEAHARWCNDNKVLAEFVRFHPLLQNWRFFPGEVIDDRPTVYIDLRSDNLLATYSTRARTAVRKAWKSGLRVEFWSPDRFLTVFPPLYRATMSALSADTFYFFPEQYFVSLFSWSAAHLAVCLAGETVAAAAIFLRGPQFLEYHLSASTDMGKRLGANNLMLHEAAEMAKKHGCTFFHLGGGTDASQDNALLFYKRSFSGLTALFRFGRRIHQTQAYMDMKHQWELETGKEPRRVLFYRT